MNSRRSTLRDLSRHEAAEVLRQQSSARLCYDEGGRLWVLPVRYHSDGAADLVLDEAADGCLRLAEDRRRVRLEVDDFQGPHQWQTIVGWGVLVAEPAAQGEGHRYRLLLRELRGFSRAPARADA
jgi:nitroimidazol reductase NimA-like FMN-containing flavoprotein (pyridoxamine 5'-phosphate oxidase superfamily)